MWRGQTLCHGLGDFQIKVKVSPLRMASKTLLLLCCSRRERRLGAERRDTREEEVKRQVRPRFSVWISRLVDGPELTTKMRKRKSLFSHLAFTKCLLALVTFQVLGLGRSMKHNPFLQDS